MCDKTFLVFVSVLSFYFAAMQALEIWGHVLRFPGTVVKK